MCERVGQLQHVQRKEKKFFKTIDIDLVTKSDYALLFEHENELQENRI